MTASIDTPAYTAKKKGDKVGIEGEAADVGVDTFGVGVVVGAAAAAHQDEPPRHINSASPLSQKSPMHPLSFQPSMFTSNAFFSVSFHVLSRRTLLLFGGGVYPKHAHLSV